MVRFRVTQDISSVDSQLDENTFRSVYDPIELKEDTLYDKSRENTRQLTLKAFILNEDLTESEAAYVELYLFREHIINDTAIHQYLDNIDRYMPALTDALLKSIPYGRDWTKDYSHTQSTQHANRAWSGIMYACEIYPEYKGIGLDDYILQNLSNIVYAGTNDICTRILATLPERLTDEEVKEAEGLMNGIHPTHSGIFDLESALIKNGYEPALNEDCIRNYGSDAYIKDYYDERLVKW